MMEYLVIMDNNHAEYIDKKMYGMRTDYFFYLVAALMVPIAAFLVKYNALEVLEGMHCILHYFLY